MNQYPCTTDYSMFELHEFNRDIVKTKKLEDSMKKHGFIPAYPLHVVKHNGKFTIKGGHHRFYVATKLNLPVYYAVTEDIASIHELESATVSWSLKDYLISFVRTGDPEYIKVYDYHRRTNIPLSVCIPIMAGASGSSNEYVVLFKAGKFKTNKPLHAETIGSIVTLLSGLGIEWANSASLARALAILAADSRVNINRLKNKLKTNKLLITKCATVYQYLEMFEGIYNRGSKERVPIAFLCAEASKKRQQTFGKSSV